jgi:hypothetical protein
MDLAVNGQSFEISSDKINPVLRIVPGFFSDYFKFDQL